MDKDVKTSLTEDCWSYAECQLVVNLTLHTDHVAKLINLLLSQRVQKLLTLILVIRVAVRGNIGLVMNERFVVSDRQYNVLK